jgi:hypothetical protein
MRRSKINIKKLMTDNREEDLLKMQERRKKMMQLVFKKDFKNLRRELLHLQKSSHAKKQKDLQGVHS